MNTTFDTIKLVQPEWTQRVFGLFTRYGAAFQKQRQRARLRAALFDLNDRELCDIGITRGEIDYVAASSAVDLDPRYVGPPAANIREGG
jgi:uncharacterized protein YjiS (DUF1127 family)